MKKIPLLFLSLLMMCVRIEANENNYSHLYHDPLGFVNLDGHHSGPSSRDPSSAILMQIAPAREYS